MRRERKEFVGEVARATKPSKIVAGGVTVYSLDSSGVTRQAMTFRGPDYTNGSAWNVTERPLLGASFDIVLRQFIAKYERLGFQVLTRNKRVNFDKDIRAPRAIV